MTTYRVMKGNKWVSVFTNKNTAERSVFLRNKNEIACKRIPDFWLKIVEIPTK